MINAYEDNVWTHEDGSNRGVIEAIKWKKISWTGSVLRTEGMRNARKF